MLLIVYIKSGIKLDCWNWGLLLVGIWTLGGGMLAKSKALGEEAISICGAVRSFRKAECDALSVHLIQLKLR